MPRKRMIDPEFWSDEEIGRWSFATRLFYIGLWSFADDEGRLKANTMLLKSEVFPYNKHINMSKLKQEVASKVIWYEADGSQYGFIKNFLKYQRIDRASISKIPPPPKFDDSSTNVRRKLDTKLSKDKLSKVNISKGMFDEIWKKYPNRDGMKQAKSHFKNTVKTQEDWKDINKALGNYLNCEKVRKGYIKNGSTWFNNWQDWVDYKDEKPKEKTPKPYRVEDDPAFKIRG